MLTAEGCRRRRLRLWDAIPAEAGVDQLVLADPVNLRYLANIYGDPFSLGADFGALLVVRRDGSATMIYESRSPASIDAALVEERRKIVWYDGQSAGNGPRRLALLPSLQELTGTPPRIHDALTDPLGPIIQTALATSRRRKDPDEIDVLRKCMRAGEIGQTWARQHVQPGMTELDVYSGIWNAVMQHLGQAAIVYGDFAISPGPSRRGGAPTRKIIEVGEMLILDFSVIIAGYRSDFTNTLVVGKEPNPRQQKLYDLCVEAMEAGEGELRAGAGCLTVYQAVRGVFEKAGMADYFTHHAGHGLGLGHPEAPFLVRNASETLVAGDVVTLEPGLYVENVGGIRIEHNYLITDTGFERLSDHVIALN